MPRIIKIAQFHGENHSHIDNLIISLIFLTEKLNFYSKFEDL